jgi:putative addiction module CopG family antidote
MISVDLPSDIEQFVHQAVSGGKYRSEQEVVLDAIRCLRDRALHYEQLRSEIREAFDSVERGEGIDIEGDKALAAFFDDVEAEVRSELAAE